MRFIFILAIMAWTCLVAILLIKESVKTGKKLGAFILKKRETNGSI